MNMDTAPALLATVGVVADTHIPDRVENLHPALIPSLRAAGVQRILHCGDVSARRVLDELAQVAPVTAVQGNRDWFFGHNLPPTLHLNIAGVAVGLTHGHGSAFSYWWDKFQYVFNGYRFERYRRVVKRACPGARVIVFGHTHQQTNLVLEDVLYFNPGSASFSFRPEDARPSYGLLRFFQGGKAAGEILPLDGARVVARRWQEVEA
jgi:putative phosphoesterase